MPKGKTVGLIFIEGFADWEFGLLSAAIGGGEEWFDGRVIALSPQTKALRSIGGLLLTPERSTKPEDNQDLDAVAVIGSDGWSENGPIRIQRRAPLISGKAKTATSITTVQANIV